MKAVCQHVFGNRHLTNEDKFLAVTYTHGFFRKCGLCDTRKIHSKMARCTLCKVCVHKKCFLTDLYKKKEDTKTAVNSPSSADTKNSMDTRNVNVDNRAEETHVGVIKLLKQPGDAREGSGSQISKDLFETSKKHLRSGCATDANNAIGNGTTTGLGVTPSGQTLVSCAPALSNKSSLKTSHIATDGENDRSANPTPTVSDGPGETRVDADPRAKRRQQLYDAIAAMAAEKISTASAVAVTERPVVTVPEKPVPVAVSKQLQRDARSTGGDDVEVPVDVSLSVSEKTLSFNEPSGLTRSLLENDREARAMRDVQRKNDQRRMNELFAWIAVIEPVKQDPSLSNLVEDELLSTDPTACVATSNGPVEDGAGRSEAPCCDPVEKPSPWFAGFDVDELERIHDSGLVEQTVENETTSIVHGTVDPVKSESLGDVVDAEPICEDGTSVVESCDPFEMSSCVTGPESAEGHGTNLMAETVSHVDERKYNESMRAEEARRLSRTFKRIARAKRLNPASNETELLRVIVKEGWIDPPSIVQFRNYYNKTK